MNHWNCFVFFVITNRSLCSICFGKGSGCGGGVLGGGIQAWWRFWSPFRSRIFLKTLKNAIKFEWLNFFLLQNSNCHKIFKNLVWKKAEYSKMIRKTPALHWNDRKFQKTFRKRSNCPNKVSIISFLEKILTTFWKIVEFFVAKFKLSQNLENFL